MGRRWMIIIFILLAISLLIWGGARRSAAQQERITISKPERFYSRKILEKLDVVLQNQNLILNELKGIRRRK